MIQEPEIDVSEVEPDLERLSEELVEQVQKAKDRIADRYTRLVEDRSFAGPRKTKR